MTKDEALELALEALQDLLLEFRGHDLPYGSKAYSKGIDITHKIKEALAQPDPVLAEREACAKVVENTSWSHWFQSDCASAIRARSRS